MIVSSPRVIAVVGQEYIYNLKANDLNQDPLTYRLDKAPTGMDTYQGSFGSSLSLNKYLYTHGNPINAIDPSGEVTLTEVMSTIASFTGLAILVAGVPIAYYSSLINSKYASRPATEYKKDHRSEAKNISEFLIYLDGKSEREFYGNEVSSNTHSVFGYIIPYYEGPPKEYRYLKDDISSGKVEFRYSR